MSCDTCAIQKFAAKSVVNSVLQIKNLGTSTLTINSDFVAYTCSQLPVISIKNLWAPCSAYQNFYSTRRPTKYAPEDITTSNACLCKARQSFHLTQVFPECKMLRRTCTEILNPSDCIIYLPLASSSPVTWHDSSAPRKQPPQPNQLAIRLVRAEFGFCCHSGLLIHSISNSSCFSSANVLFIQTSG